MLLRHQYLGYDLQIHNLQGIKLYKSTFGMEFKKTNHLKPEAIPLRVQIALKSWKSHLLLLIFNYLEYLHMVYTTLHSIVQAFTLLTIKWLHLPSFQIASILTFSSCAPVTAQLHTSWFSSSEGQHSCFVFLLLTFKTPSSTGFH